MQRTTKWLCVQSLYFWWCNITCVRWRNLGHSCCNRIARRIDAHQIGWRFEVSKIQLIMRCNLCRLPIQMRTLDTLLNIFQCLFYFRRW